MRTYRLQFKDPFGLVQTACVVQIPDTHEDIDDLHKEYLKQRRDKYDVYGFANWILTTDKDAVVHKPSAGKSYSMMWDRAEPYRFI